MLQCDMLTAITLHPQKLLIIQNEAVVNIYNKCSFLWYSFHVDVHASV